MQQITLGTIGSGTIVHSVLNNVIVTNGMNYEAAYSRTEEKAQALMNKYKGKKFYTDLDALFNDEKINTIYIATPNLLHYEQTKRALLAGKNVICEKPFVTKYSQAKELIELAKSKGLFLFEAAPTMFLPNFKVLKHELDKIGQVRLVISNYSQYSSRYDLVLKGEKPNIFNPEYAGGCLMDINFYNVLLNVALFGAPEEAVYYPNIYPGLADTSGSFVMKYDGFISQNAGAKDTWGFNFFQIEGEQGYIFVSEGSNGLKSVRVVTKGSNKIFNEQLDPDRWNYEVREITRIMKRDDYEAAYSMFNVTLETVRVIENARKQAGIIFPGDDE